MRGVWAWCVQWLPEDQTNRFLVVTVVVSVLLHVLVGVALITGGNIEQRRIASKRGEALLVDIAPDKPKETAPLGDPSRHAGPNVPEPPRQAAPPTPPAPKAAPAPPPPAAPRIAEAPKAAPKAPPAAPKSAEPGPVPKAASPAPDPDQSQTARATPQPATAQPHSAADQRVASAPPQPSPLAGMYRKGGGGGLKGGRGGTAGEPIPLDTPDPNYSAYMQKVKQRIYEKWGYPYEAVSRGLTGQLVIEFHIAKDGHVQYIDLRESSGQEILDNFAMTAVKLGQFYPPLPEAMQRDVLPIVGIFVYKLQESRSMLQLLH